MFFAIVIKDSSTLCALFADVSMNGILYCLDKSIPSSYDTYLLSIISHLFPINILFTPS